jgi:RNA polymerase sigma factor (TIGR02999 family)
MTSEPERSAKQLTETLYRELRLLAARRLKAERPGQTLNATDLVHEAILRIGSLASTDACQTDAQIFFAAAEAMRRILIEQARRKQRQKHGGHLKRISLSIAEPVSEPEDLISLEDIHVALTKLEALSPDRADVVKLRFFGGLPMPEVAQALCISLATAERRWAMARAWIHRELTLESQTKIDY